MNPQEKFPFRSIPVFITRHKGSVKEFAVAPQSTIKRAARDDNIPNSDTCLYQMGGDLSGSP
jgi:hypothetical protein